MRTLPLDQVEIEQERWRRDFDEDAIGKLAESIDKFGLLHAPVVKNDGKTLVAGERRLRAVTKLAGEDKSITFNGKDIPLGRIPIILMSEMDDLDYKEAELEENLKREDLSWQERSHAVSELHKLRTAQREELGEYQSRMDTAKELSPDPEDEKLTQKSYQEVRDDLLISAFLDDPDVSAAKNRDEAKKILRKKLEKAHKEQLAKEFEIGKLDTTHEAIRGDLTEVLPKIEAHKFSCIIADPPYGVDADTFKNQKAVKHAYKDSEEYSNEIVACIAREGMRVTTLKAHLYLFCDILRFPIMKQIMENHGWDVWKTPLIWYRGSNIGIAPRPEHGPRRTYEAILYAIKNDRRVTGICPDVLIEYHDKSVQYGAHKPPSLYENLIQRSCLPGDHVLDPCCGTGPVFLAAETTQTIATGIELMEEPFGYAVARLKGLKEI